MEESYVEEGYFADPLVVWFEKDDAAALGCESIEVLELAGKVVYFWENYFSRKRACK